MIISIYQREFNERGILLKIKKEVDIAYQFEDVVTLFLDRDEFKSGELQEFIERNDLIIDDFNEDVASVYMKGEDITIPFIIELEDILDSRITICNRFLGSSDTIKSLGLD